MSIRTNAHRNECLKEERKNIRGIKIYTHTHRERERETELQNIMDRS